MILFALYPRGGMDMDTDLQYVDKGNQLYSKNTRAITKMGQTGWAKEIVVGNILAFQLGALNTAQNKIIRFYINNLTVGQVWSVSFYDQNHILIGTASYTVAAGPPPLTTVFTNFHSAITTVLNAGTPSWAHNWNEVDEGGGFGYFEIDLFQNYSGSNWYAVYSGITDVRQEAWSEDILGRFQATASEDFLGNLFIFSTTVTNMPTDIEINSISNSGGSVLVSLSQDHGLSDGDQVYLSDTGATLSGGKTADGYWLITVVTDTSFTLDAQTFSTSSANVGTMTKWPKGIGEIGVATYNEHVNIWTYTRLLRSTQLNFRLPRQHDTPKILHSNNKWDIYYTDFYNVPGVFYYHGAFYTDGALQNTNPGTLTGDEGLYAYDTIADETALQQAPNTAHILFDRQDTVGGALPSGSWRYAQRLLTESLSGTPYSTLTNPVIVYQADQTGPAYNILAPSLVGETTHKVNYLTVQQINQDLFKYIELVAVFYSTNSLPQAFTISRTLINSDTMTLVHSGNESGIEFLDINQLLATNEIIVRAKSNLIMEGRLLLGNIDMAEPYDLLPWTTTFEHTLLKYSINDIGDIDVYFYGEYQNPEHVNQVTGYCALEQYRFFLKPYYKNGLIGEPFFIDDIDFTTSATNVVTEGNAPYGNRRVAGLADYDMTDDLTTPARNVYSFYVQFSNIDLDYKLPDGKRIRDVIKYFEIGRAECIKEVLSTGVVMPSSLDGSDYVPQIFWAALATAPATPGTYPQAIDTDPRTLGFFISPDTLYGQADIGFQAGDEVYMFGQLTGHKVVIYTTAGLDSVFVDFRGSLTAPPDNPKIVEALVKIATFGQGGDISTTALGTVPYLTTLPGSSPNNWIWDFQYLIGLDDAAGNFFQLAAATDPGVYSVAYYRRNTDKYGAVTEGKWIPTGHRYTIQDTSASIIGLQNVWGGDTFTQKTWYHAMYRTETTQDDNAYGLSFYSQNRVNVQMHYNTVQGDGRVFPENFGSNVPFDTNTWLDDIHRDKFLFSNTYIPANLIDDQSPYDPALARNYSFPARIVYSAVRPEGSPLDSLRLLPAFQFYDCEGQYGDLIHMEAVQKRLITFQPDQVTLQYFDANGNLQTSDINQSIIVGSPGVFPRKGTGLSGWGTKHKFSVKKGIDSGGYDFVMWINTEHRKLMLYSPGRGVRSISDLEGFRSWMANNTAWADDWDEPANGQGICVGWDGRYSDMLFTVRAKRGAVLWVHNDSYEVGDIVYISEQPAGTYTNFEKTGELYVCTVANTGNFGVNDPEGGADWEDFWEKAEHTDNEYFNEYTFAYNAVKDKVTDFYSFKPKIYFACDDKILSPLPCELTGSGDPIGENRIYEHDRGRYAGWYESGTFAGATLNLTVGSTTVTASSGLLAQFPHPEVFTYLIPHTVGSVLTEYVVASVTNDTTLVLESAAVATTTLSNYKVLQSEDAQIEMVMNVEPNVSKNFRALHFTTDIQPYRVELADTARESFLVSGDFRFREGYWVSTIKKDSTGTGINTNNTSRLFGKYLKVKLYLQRLVYQKLFNFGVSLIDNPRKP